MKVKELIKLLLEKDQEADIAVGATDSRWDTVGCSVSSGEWYPDKTISGIRYGDTYGLGLLKTRGKPVVVISPR